MKDLTQFNKNVHPFSPETWTFDRWHIHVLWFLLVRWSWKIPLYLGFYLWNGLNSWQDDGKIFWYMLWCHSYLGQAIIYAVMTWMSLIMFLNFQLWYGEFRSHVDLLSHRLCHFHLQYHFCIGTLEYVFCKFGVPLSFLYFLWEKARATPLPRCSKIN